MSSSHGRRAFTLVEMLAVMGILALLVIVSVPAFHAVSRSSALAASTATLVDQLNLAHQSALTRNASVEVRLYKLPDDDAQAGSPSVWRAVQLFIQSDDGIRPLDKASWFTPRVICIDDPTVSSLFQVVAESTPGASDPEIGTFGKNYRYRAFRFRPGGSTNLPDSMSIHLTLKVQTDANVKDGLPANFATVQIDPVTGRVRTFRP